MILACIAALTMQTWSCTAQVLQIAVSDGQAWAATSGGVIHVSKVKTRRLTVGKGLLSDEVLGLVNREGGLYAQTPTGLQILHPEKAKISTNGLSLAADSSPGLVLSTAEHEGSRVAASFDTGLQASTDGVWSAFEPKLPDDAGVPTAVVSDGGVLWVGTMGSHLWSLRDGEWHRHMPNHELPGSSVQSISVVGGSVFVSTLDAGLVNLSEGSSLERSAGLIPREMVEFQGRAWLRTSEGSILTKAATGWVKPPFLLPRKQATCLATAGSKLLIGQFGGWTEWDGSNATHLLKIPELQGVSVTALALRSDGVVVGTQTRGLGIYSEGTFRWIDQGLALGDDWVTELYLWGDALAVGTFVAGLAILDGSGLRKVEGLEGTEVTALCQLSDNLLVGTRAGLFVVKKGEWRAEAAPMPQLPLEVQALAVHNGEVWIGARTGLVKLKASGF